jgi:hypothetical protein
MNREGLIKHWEIVKAYKEGKQIQYYSHTKNKWVDESNPEFFENLDYRVKPEPLELWVNVYANNVVLHRTEEVARISACNPVRTAVHMREVAEDEEYHDECPR